MATWKNLDTLDSFGKLKELKNHVDIAAALSGEEGGKRVADYSTPMAAGLSYNYAAKEVDETVLYESLEEKMKGIMGTRVFIHRKKNNKGKIEIEYYSRDELERIIELFESIR